MMVAAVNSPGNDASSTTPSLNEKLAVRITRFPSYAEPGLITC